MKIGFIGAGNMAGAIIRGAVKAGMPAGDIAAYDVDSAKASALGVTAATDCAEMIAQSDVVLLAVKPNVAPGVLKQYRQALEGKALFSIVAGMTNEKLAQSLSGKTRYLRIMPNTPALVSAGMAAFTEENTLSEAEKAFAVQLFEAIGSVQWVHEYQMDGVVGVSGSGPAYVYMFIEALADGGVMEGLTRPQAMRLAAQTVLGAAKMVMDTGEHPGALKDMVCSPAGTTIAAVKALEEGAFRATVMETVEAAADKSREMAGQK